MFPSITSVVGLMQKPSIDFVANEIHDSRANPGSAITAGLMLASRYSKKADLRSTISWQHRIAITVDPPNVLPSIE